MKNINIHNYEIFFLDYFEKSLSQNDTRELFAFLDENPELKEEFYNFEMTLLKDNKIIYPDKKQFTIADNIDNEIIALIEGDINSKGETRRIKNKIETNLIYRYEFQMYSKTKLLPEPILYADKDSLKRKNRIPFYYYGVAATFLLFLGIVFYFSNQTNTMDIHALSSHKVAGIGFRVPDLQATNIKERHTTLNQEGVSTSISIPSKDIKKNTNTNISRKRKANIAMIEKYVFTDIPLEPDLVPAIETRLPNLPTRVQKKEKKFHLIKVLANLGKVYLRNTGKSIFKNNRDILKVDIMESLVAEYNKLSDNDITLTKVRDDEDKVLAIYVSNRNRRLFRYKKR
jgi:hypothetical protein